MNRSELINELAGALSKAQGEIEGAVKGNVNPAFRSKYADLGAVWEAIREPISKAGLSIVQALERTDGGVACETLLMHTSGQWLSSRFEVPVSKADAQGYGSAATYCRRYALMAMVGIAPIDDDANAAVGKPKAEPKDTAPLDQELLAKLRGCKSLEELQAVWAEIPVNVRARYVDEKNVAKDRIGGKE